MKKLRSHAAIALDGGGIRGLMIARALAVLEKKRVFGEKTCNQVFRLAAGTSTGSIISAGLAAGLTGGRLFELYQALGPVVFRQTLRSALWLLFRYRYDPGTLLRFLHQYLGTGTMGEIGPMRLVITTFDLVENRTRFITTGKPQYADWQVAEAVLASCSVPTYFPPVKGQFVDGGVGSYANPCYLAAYEACIVRRWDPGETTLISLGTGRDPHSFTRGDADHFWPWDWLAPVLGAFQQSADDEQVRVVKTFFRRLDFRRFQVNFSRSIPLDDAGKDSLNQLVRYGDELAELIMKDRTDTEATTGAHTLPVTMQ
jgi:hypothetical protein